MYTRILIPTDGSACSDGAVAHGVAIARAMGSAIVFLYVMDTLQAQREGVVTIAEAIQALTAQGRIVLARAEGVAASVGVRAAAVADVAATGVPWLGARLRGRSVG